MHFIFSFRALTTKQVYEKGINFQKVNLLGASPAKQKCQNTTKSQRDLQLIYAGHYGATFEYCEVFTIQNGLKALRYSQTTYTSVQSTCGFDLSVDKWEGYIQTPQQLNEFSSIKKDK